MKNKSAVVLPQSSKKSGAQHCKNIMVAVSMALLLTGCNRSIDPHFYTLSPKMTALINSNVKLIEVMPVTLPERLNTPLMVLQKSNGQTYKLDSQRWSSDLSDQLHSALSAGLQQKLGAIDVYTTGLTGNQVSYLIAPEFSRFDIVEGTQGEQTHIEVMSSWVIKRKDANNTAQNAKMLPSQQLNCRMNFSHDITGQSQNFVHIVAAYQESLNRVTDAIAATTIALDAQKTVQFDGVVCS